MEYVHVQKNSRHTPRKMRLVADVVRGMSPQQAMDALEFVNRSAAVDLSKAIKAALANVGSREVGFKKIEINEGVKMKRFRAGTAGRGRGRSFVRRLSHIKIVLTDEVANKTIKKGDGHGTKN